MGCSSGGDKSGQYELWFLSYTTDDRPPRLSQFAGFYYGESWEESRAVLRWLGMVRPELASRVDREARKPQEQFIEENLPAGQATKTLGVRGRISQDDRGCWSAALLLHADGLPEIT